VPSSAEPLWVAKTPDRHSRSPSTEPQDGWEREGEDDYFFHESSERRAFPLGINLISYVMTH
jgi:hypothetical protein